MDPSTNPLYAGFANLELATDPFDLGEGLTLSGTYGRLMSSLTLATMRPTHARPYGEPWAAVLGGFAFDLSVQLFLPLEFHPLKWFDRLNTIWWIAALIRLRSSPVVVVPCISRDPFGAVANRWHEAELLALETEPRRILPMPMKMERLEDADLEWIREHWRSGGHLMHQHREFRTSFQAFDLAPSSGSVALALISLWGALEELFSPAKQELRFRVSSSIAAYLEPPGEDRLACHKRMLKLYDARSKVAHGTAGDEMDPFRETHALMRRVLIRIIEDNRVPSRAEVERLVFGCNPAK